VKLVDCRRCGSKELLTENGYAICVYCRTKFILDADEVPPLQSSISMLSDIERLLKLCRDEPKNRRRYAGLILDIDPTNAEARKYL
jgi:hypothetical protein